MRLLRHGAIGVSDYSGLDAPKEAMRAVLPAIESITGVPKRPEIRWVRSCDWAALPQRVLCMLSGLETHSEACVFMDLKNRMPPNAQDFCKAMAPSKNDPIDDTVQKTQ